MVRAQVSLSVLVTVSALLGCSAGGSDTPAIGHGGTSNGGGSAAPNGGSTNGGNGGTLSTGGVSGSTSIAGIGGALGGGGGSVGVAGTAGVGAGGGSAGSGAVGCGSLPLCDDFEGVAAGAAPDPSKWTATVLSDCMSNAAKPLVDDSQHHSGTRSLKVAGTATFCDYAMVGNSTAFKAVGNVVYGRYYVRFETALPAGHTAFMIFPDMMSGHSLRMGGQNSALQWNRQSDDATLPSQSPAGIALSKVPPVGAWMCLEFMIDQAQGFISTWVDGNLVAGLVADGTPTADVDMAWGTAYKPSLTGFNIGWQNYGAGAMNLWFDDVALSATRIGCN